MMLVQVFLHVVHTSFFSRRLKNDSSWRAPRSDQLRHYACPPPGLVTIWRSGVVIHWYRLTLWNLIWAHSLLSDTIKHGAILYPAECGNGQSNSLGFRKQNISRSQSSVNRSKTWCDASWEAFLWLVLSQNNETFHFNIKTEYTFQRPRTYLMKLIFVTWQRTVTKYLGVIDTCYFLKTCSMKNFN